MNTALVITSLSPNMRLHTSATSLHEQQDTSLEAVLQGTGHSALLKIVTDTYGIEGLSYRLNPK